MKKLFIFIFILIISVIAHETAALKNYKVAVGVIVLIATVGTAYQMTLAPIFWLFSKLKNKQDAKKSEKMDKEELGYDNTQEEHAHDSEENKHIKTNKTKNCTESILDHKEPLDGDLYKIAIARIPNNQDLSDPICANGGVVDGGRIDLGIIHTVSLDIPWYIGYSEGKILAEGEDLETVAHDALVQTGSKINLSAEEISELEKIVSIQDDADYYLDEESWEYSLGECGEINAGPECLGGVIINVTPYYSTNVTLVGDYGESDDEPCDSHEFCGILKTNASHSSESLDETSELCDDEAREPIDLYKEDWLGEDLEVWLDSVEDTGLWKLKAGESMIHGKSKISIKCLDVDLIPHHDDDTMKIKKSTYQFSKEKLDSFTMTYHNVIDSEGNVEEKVVYYSDDDGNNLPLHNFHWSKWEKSFK